MPKNNSSWFPLKNFTKKGCHFDFMIGISSWRCKDFLDGSIIKPFTSVFWNRTLGNISISLDTYNKAVKDKDPKILEKMKSIGLPLDIKL